ncbi:M50 family metallopeptidase [Flexivirga sp. ID2601S]|uniref:M50 family metallopeptidase n=1 Tax=Flexivirga aerilata TaxID=1656889 RepID=A0A849AJU0_9MICO|nr:M50 family metallopeptidase [Flexivirga aerilata]
MDQWWQRATATNAPLDARVTAALALVAAACILWAPAWRASRHVVTVAHEGAHGVVALLAGRSLSGIRLHSDSSGLTVSRGRARGFGMVATLFAGYVGPGVLGLLLASVLHSGHAVAALWLLLGALTLLLLQIRNLYGLWVVLVSGIALFAVTWWLSDDVQVGVAQTITWFLLLACPWSIIDLQRTRRAGRGRGSDPDQLARITPIPAGLWVTLMLLVALACLGLGGWLMLA